MYLLDCKHLDPYGLRYGKPKVRVNEISPTARWCPTARGAMPKNGHMKEESFSQLTDPETIMHRGIEYPSKKDVIIAMLYEDKSKDEIAEEAMTTRRHVNRVFRWHKEQKKAPPKRGKG